MAITLSGSATDPGADTLSYAWDLDNNGSYETLGQSVSYTWSQEGTYIVGLRVTDDDGGVGTDIATVAVNDLGPSAAFSYSPASPIVGEMVQFTDKSTSYDGIASWWWDFGDGRTSTEQNPTHVYQTAGTYVVTLTVTEADTDSDMTSQSIMVSGVLNEPPVAEADGPYTGDEGSAITFDASASRDVDGVIILYEWDWDGDGVYNEGSTSPTITHSWNDNYSGTIRLRVTDDYGATATDTASVTIYNVAPTAEAGGPYSGDEGLAITLSGSATDPGADTLSYAWDLDNNGSYETLGQSVSYTWTQVGTYSVGLRVTDDDGGVGTDTATVTVGLLHITGLIRDIGGRSLEGVTFYLRDPAGNVVDSDISETDQPYDVTCYAGTYDLVVDATLYHDLELTFHDIPVIQDITDADIVIATYATCPHLPPGGKLHLKSKEISAASSIIANGVTLKLYYTQSEVGSAGIYEPTLKIYHWTGTSWEELATTVDTTNNVLTAFLSSLSPNGAFGDPVAGVPAFPSLYIAITAAFAAGILAYFISRKLVRQE